MEKFIPSKDLPEEITSLPHEETVCKYCGVSYLIHHEIKSLEETIQELKSELKRCHKLESRVTVLEQERDDLKQKLLDIEGTKDTIQERCDDFQEKLKQINEAYHHSEERSRELSSCVTALEQEREDLKQKLFNTEGNKDALQKRCDDLQKKLKLADETFYHSEENLQSMQLDISSLKEKFESCKYDLELSSRNVKRFRNRMDMMRNGITTVCTIASYVQQCCKDCKVLVTESRQQMKTTIGSLQAGFNVVLKHHSEANSKLMERIHLLKVELIKEQELSTVQKERILHCELTKKLEVQAKSKKLALAVAELTDNHQCISELKEKLRTLQIKNTKIEKEREEQIEELLSSLHAAKVKISGTELDKRALQKRMEAVHQELALSREMLNKNTEQFMWEKSDLQAEVSALQADLNHVQGEQACERMQYAVEKKSLLEDLRHCKCKLQLKEHALTAVVTEMNHLHHEIDVLQVTIERQCKEREDQ